MVHLGSAHQRTLPQRHGEMSERLKEPVLKTGEAQVSVGSNPTLSAKFLYCLRKYPRGRRGSPAKGVGWIKPARGFKSLLPRQKGTLLKLLVISGGFLAFFISVLRPVSTCYKQLHEHRLLSIFMVDNTMIAGGQFFLWTRPVLINRKALYTTK